MLFQKAGRISSAQRVDKGAQSGRSHFGRWTTIVGSVFAFRVCRMKYPTKSAPGVWSG